MNGGQHCNDSMAEQRDCCLVQSADLAGIARASQSAPSLVLLGEIVIEPPSPATVAHAAVSDPGVPIGTPPPTYLLDSVFRI
jgi:hypothetical protein